MERQSLVDNARRELLDQVIVFDEPRPR